MRRPVVSAVGTVLLVGILLIWTFVAGNEPLLGLDLQGGASVVFEPTTDVSGGRLEQAIEIMDDRVNSFGAREPEIYEQGGNIVVDLPGIDDQDRVLDQIGQTAELRFRAVLQVLPSQAEIDAFNATTTTSATGDATTTTAAGAEATTTTTTDVEAEDATTTTRGASRRIQAQPDETTTTGEPDATTTTVEPDETTSTTSVEVDGADTTIPTIPLPELTTSGGTGQPDATAPLGTVDRCLADAAARGAAAPYRSEAGTAAVDDVTGVTPGDADVPCDQVVLQEVDDDGNQIARYILGPTQFTGTIIDDAAARVVNSEWSVITQLRGGASGQDLFNEAAASCFALSTECPNRNLAFVLDGIVLSAPQFQESSFGSEVFITGNFTEGEAKDLARNLRFGALPVELVPQTTQIVSATIGEDALDAGILAGVVGMALVALFMILYYRGLGVIASLSLLVAIGLTWVVIAWLGETQDLAITLAGVTGLIVSIGIAVDSNIVYFEHLKEDVRNGRSVRSAVERAFPSAFSTILKADFASLIGAGLLYFLTVGAVKGFALYLGIATIVDLVVTYFLLGPLVRVVARHRSFEAHPGRYGIPTAREAS